MAKCMYTRTYDRNVLRGQALIANEDYTNVRYTNIWSASTVIEQVDLPTLQILHYVANRAISKNNNEVKVSEWSRFSQLKKSLS